MLISRCLALIVMLLCLPVLAQEQPKRPPALTKEQQAKLKERAQLLKEAEKLGSEGKLSEAIDAAEKMLAIEREVFGNFHETVAGSLEFLAEVHEHREDFTAARKARQEVLGIQTKLLGAQHWRVTDARIALEGTERLARLDPVDRRRLGEEGQLSRQVVQLYQQGKTQEAIPLAQKALELRKQVLGERHPDYSRSLNNLALLYKSQGEYGKVVLTDGDVTQLADSYVELALATDPDLRASGTIAPDGSFWLQTQYKGQLHKGAPEGTYQARIILGDESEQARPKRRSPPVHARFLDFKKSGLTVQVPTGGDVTLTLARR
jgi:tetratricopeptide (TPR) repeat protein